MMLLGITTCQAAAALVRTTTHLGNIKVACQDSSCSMAAKAVSKQIQIIQLGN
jgi:hypothetical protein